MSEDLHPTSPNHDSRGRYIRGNQCGKLGGNPIAKEVIRLRQAMLAVLTPEAMREVTLRHLDLIRKGPPKVAVDALALLYDRLFGRAKESIEVDLTTTAPLIDASRYTDTQLGQILDMIEQPFREAQVITAEAHPVKSHLSSDQGSVQYGIPEEPAPSDNP